MKYYVFYSVDECGEDVYYKTEFGNKEELLKHRNRPRVTYLSYHVIHGSPVVFEALVRVTEFKIVE